MVSVKEIITCDHLNERYRSLLYAVGVFIFESVDVVLKCDHTDESFGQCFYHIKPGEYVKYITLLHCAISYHIVVFQSDRFTAQR